MKHELRAMAGQGSGSIVNIASTYGHKAATGATAYVSSKFAVEGLTKTVALEQGNSGIRVNAVGPGPTDTVMLDRFTGTAEGNDALIATVPMRRRGTPEELANAIVFISSPRSVLHFWHGVRSGRRHVGNLSTLGEESPGHGQYCGSVFLMTNSVTILPSRMRK
jgi:NAD(P)-dependent dehydrogenase (short-subunit alcohol dehydrogenase family)